MRTATIAAVFLVLVAAGAAQAGGQDQADRPDTDADRTPPGQDSGKPGVTFDRIAAGETVDVTVDRAERIGVSRISISVAHPARNVTVTVTPQDGRPAAVERNVSGTPYRYIAITASNLSDDDITRAEIGFTVNTSWLADQDADRDAVQLARYVNETWDPLPTSVAQAADRNVTYVAETPGFSYFAVFARDEEPTEIVCGNGICQDNQTWASCPHDCEKPQHVVDAEQAIAAAEHRIDRGDDGYGLLQAAQDAYGAGNYSRAADLAERAVDANRTPDRDLIRMLVPVLLPFAVLLLMVLWKRDALAERWSEDRSSGV